MKKLVVAGFAAAIVAGAVIAYAAGSGWQSGYCRTGGDGPRSGRMYDLSRETTVIGTVASVEQIAGRGRMRQGRAVEVTLKSGNDTVLVHLGPKWYLDKQANMTFASGDPVEIRGARAMLQGEEVLLAAEVKKGTKVLKLRDENGTPLWASARRILND